MIDENAKKNKEHSNVHSQIISELEEISNETMVDKQSANDISETLTSSLMLAFLNDVACSFVMKINATIKIESTINGTRHRSKNPLSVFVMNTVDNIAEI